MAARRLHNERYDPCVGIRYTWMPISRGLRAYLLALADMRGFDVDDKETRVLAHAAAGNDDA